MTPESQAAREVIYFYYPDHELAIRPGGFTKALIEAMARADRINLTLLHSVYPHHVYAVRTIAFEDGGVVHLIREIAEWEAAA